MYFYIVQPLVLKKYDKASPSIILAGQALLVKMVITLEPLIHLVQILNTFFSSLFYFFFFFILSFFSLLFLFYFIYLFAFLLFFFFFFFFGGGGVFSFWLL